MLFLNGAEITVEGMSCESFEIINLYNLARR